MIQPKSAAATDEQPPSTVSHTYLQPEADAESSSSASSGRASTPRQTYVNIPRWPISGGRASREATPLTSREYSIHGESDTWSQGESDMDVDENLPAAIASITNNKEHLPKYLPCNATTGPSNMNELRDSNDE